MSNKRVCNEDGWYVINAGNGQRVTVRDPPGVPRLMPARRSLAADAVIGIMDTWYFQDATAWMKLCREQAVALASLQQLKLSNQVTIDQQRRAITRRNTLLNIANEQIAGLRREVDFKTALIAEMFARFPEVAHEYEWAYNPEVLGEHFEEEIDTDREDE